MDQLPKMMEGYYAKAPALPVNAREFIVSVSPWLALIFGVLTILASLSAFGISAVATPFLALGGASPLMLMLVAVLGLAQGVLMVAAFSPLRRRVARGWTLLFWVEVLGVVSSVLSLSVGSVVVGVIIAAIVFYFLFQVRPYYK